MTNGRASGLLAATVASAWLVTGDAGAICGKPWDVLVAPPEKADAPLNTHVWLRTPTESPDGPVDFALRAAPGGVTARTDWVPVDRRISPSPELTDVELIPRTLLAPHARYEVVVTDPTGARPARLVGTFVTGDAPDTRAPTWTGATAAHLEGFPSSRTGQPMEIMMECGGRGIGFDAPSAQDDHAAPADLRYAVWMQDARGRIDYASPPIAFAQPAGLDTRSGGKAFHLELGGDYLAETFVPTVAAVRARGPRVRFGLRAVDLAGNASPPSEVLAEVPGG